MWHDHAERAGRAMGPGVVCVCVVRREGEGLAGCAVGGCAVGGWRQALMKVKKCNAGLFDGLVCARLSKKPFFNPLSTNTYDYSAKMAILLLSGSPRRPLF